MKGVSVHEARREMGRILAAEHPADADMVIAVPGHGPFGRPGILRRSRGSLRRRAQQEPVRRAGRSSSRRQSLRERGVKLKLNPLPDSVRGKRLIVVDDSIVRGTTTRQIVAMLREAGAAEIHIRITCPPISWPCFYGIDMCTRAGARRGGSRRRRDPRVRRRGLAGLPLARGNGPSDGGAGRGLLSRVLRRGVPDPGPRARRQVHARGQLRLPTGVARMSDAYATPASTPRRGRRRCADRRTRRGGAAPGDREDVGGFAGLYPDR